MRHRRQINFYQLLANVSGGSVIQTDKNNIGSALNLLKVHFVFDIVIKLLAQHVKCN